MSLCKAGSRCAARLLLISAVAAALVGCSSASRQMRTDRGLYQTHHEQFSTVRSERRLLHRPTITAKKARHKNNNSTAIAESHKTLKMDASSPDDKSDIVTTTPTVATKTEIPHDEATKPEIPPSPQLDNDSVIKKAKATIAAKMSDPDSVEFQDMERSDRKNALGKNIDTICGFVRDKNGGPKPFLYIVQKNEAFIGGYTIATSEYRNICSITTLPGR